MSKDLEKPEDLLVLTLIIVEPLRTTAVEATEEQPELFCTEIDESWLEQQESEQKEEMHMHEEDPSSLKRRLLLGHDCQELEIHTMGVCD